MTWTPVAGSNEIDVEIYIGGGAVFYHQFFGNDGSTVHALGDNYKIDGTLNTEFAANGVNGQLDGDLTWTVGTNQHLYQGLIGLW